MHLRGVKFAFMMPISLRYRAKTLKTFTQPTAILTVVTGAGYIVYLLVFVVFGKTSTLDGYLAGSLQIAVATEKQTFTLLEFKPLLHSELLQFLFTGIVPLGATFADQEGKLVFGPHGFNLAAKPDRVGFLQPFTCGSQYAIQLRAL